MKALLAAAAVTALLYLGGLLFGGFSLPRGRPAARKPGGPPGAGRPGDPGVCPVCAARLGLQEQVRSFALPSLGGGDRLLHIKGCPYCLEGGRPRSCPVCGASLAREDFLVARLFEKPRRSHVHVLGCSHCRGRGERGPAN